MLLDRERVAAATRPLIKDMMCMVPSPNFSVASGSQEVWEEEAAMSCRWNGKLCHRCQLGSKRPIVHA
jgi:hypothetical protein